MHQIASWKNCVVFEDCFTYKAQKYTFEDVAHLDFSTERINVTVNFIPAGTDAKAYLLIHLTGGRPALLIQYQGSINKYPGPKPVAHAEAIAQIYQCLAIKTYSRRLEVYLSEISRQGYFQYGDYRFYENGDIATQGKHFQLDALRFHQVEKGLSVVFPEKIKNNAKKHFWEVLTPSEVDTINFPFGRDWDCMHAIIPKIYRWVKFK